MNMTICTSITEYKINLAPVSQWCGKNIRRKRQILDILCQYFSSNRGECRASSILIDNEEVGRKYYQIYRINTKEDLVNAIKIGKTTLMYQYLKSLVGDFDYQDSLLKIDDILTMIFESLNNEMNKLGNVELMYHQEQIWDMVQKVDISGKDDRLISDLENLELIEIYIRLQEQLQHRIPDKKIYIFENLDHLLEIDEYKKVYSECYEIANKSDSCFIFTTSLDSYVVLSNRNINSITIINEEEYVLDNIEFIYNFIKENYPCDINFNEKEIIDCLINIIHDIGAQMPIKNIRDLVVCKLFNKEMCIHSKWRIKPCQPEISFMIQ